MSLRKTRQAAHAAHLEIERIRQMLVTDVTPLLERLARDTTSHQDRLARLERRIDDVDAQMLLATNALHRRVSTLEALSGAGFLRRLRWLLFGAIPQVPRQTLRDEFGDTGVLQ